jgi:hypothetical protein
VDAPNPLLLIDEHIVSLLLALTSDWTERDLDTEARPESLARVFLCWAGLIEMKLRGRAWTESNLNFEATVRGQWDDGEHRSFLPDEIRRCVPAWVGKEVRVQCERVYQVRLTVLGELKKRELEADPEYEFQLLEYVHREPVKGQARIRIISNEMPSLGVVQDGRKKGIATPEDLRDTKKNAEDKRLDVKTTIEALSESGVWGTNATELARRLAIPYKSVCRYLQHPDVSPTWSEYKRQSVGKGPASLDDLGDNH